MVITIKERLISRLKVALAKVGPSWRQELAKHDVFFDSLEGARYMDTAAQSVTNPKRGSVDRIERVTLALEKIACIESQPVI